MQPAPQQGRINDVSEIIACLLTLKHRIQNSPCSCDLSVGYICETCFQSGLIGESLKTALKLERALIEESEGE